MRYLALLLTLFIFLPVRAQDTEEKNALEIITEQSEGKITFDIPEPILETILRDETGKKGSASVNKGAKGAGYRIQIFSESGNQSSIERRAKERGSALIEKFPKYKGQVYTFSKSPSWYTRVGNFRTASEANSALAELKKAFPSWATEMRIVKSQIVVVK